MLMGSWIVTLALFLVAVIIIAKAIRVVPQQHATEIPCNEPLPVVGEVVLVEGIGGNLALNLFQHLEALR